MSRSECKEFKIIGGGLAGLSLGIGLRNRGIPVELHEAGHYPRHRVCGEFISGVSNHSLELIGIEDVFEGMPRHRTHSWYYFDEKVFQDRLPVPAIGVSRYRLDKQLADRFEQLGGRLITDSRIQIDESEPNPGLAIAAGRQRQRGGQWIGIKCHLLDYETSCDVEMHLGKGAYLGTSAVENGRVNVCGLFRVRPEVKASKSELISTYLDTSGMHSLAERLRNAETDESSCLGVSAFKFGWQAGSASNTGQLRIGDQLAMIGPFTGNGMSMAIEGASEAISPVESWAKGQISWIQCCDKVDHLLHRRFHRRLTVSRWLHPFLTEPFGQRFLTSLARRKLIPYLPLLRALR